MMKRFAIFFVCGFLSGVSALHGAESGSLVIRNWGNEERKIEKDSPENWAVETQSNVTAPAADSVAGKLARGNRRYRWLMSADPARAAGAVSIGAMAVSTDGSAVLLQEKIHHRSGRISTRFAVLHSADGSVLAGCFLPERDLTYVLWDAAKPGEVIAAEKKTTGARTTTELYRIALESGKILSSRSLDSELVFLHGNPRELTAIDQSGRIRVISPDLTDEKTLTLPPDQPRALGAIRSADGQQLYYLTDREVLTFKAYEGVWSRTDKLTHGCENPNLFRELSPEILLIGRREGEAALLCRGGSLLPVESALGCGAAKGRELIFVAGLRNGSINAYDPAKGGRPVVQLSSTRGEPKSPGELIGIAASGENELYLLTTRGQLLRYAPYRRGWKKSSLRVQDAR